MKKQLLFIVLFVALSTTYSSAQYFHDLAGTTNDDVLESGVNTFYNGPGQVYAGTTNPSTIDPTLTGITVTHTDINGSILFSNEFLMRPTNLYANTFDPHVVELNVAAAGSASPIQEFGIFGRFEKGASSNKQMFFLKLDQFGVMSSLVEISPLTSYEIIDIGGVEVSSWDKNVFVTGTARSQTLNTFHMFVLKYDYISNAVVWGYIYDLATPGLVDNIRAKDITEDKLTPVDLVVAGYYDDVASGTVDAFTVVVDRNNGFAHPMNHWGTPNSNDWFYSVGFSQQSVSDPWPSHGYILAGHTDNNKSLGNGMDMWVLRSNPSLAGWAFWTQTYNNGDDPAADDYCFAIAERMNPNTGDANYFAVGHTTSGNYGSNDVLVNKLDWNGVPYQFTPPFLADQFMYGGAGDDYGYAVDFENGPSMANGLNIFGTWGSGSGLGGTDNYDVRSYFSGHSCDYYLTNSNYNPGPDILWIVEAMDDVASLTTRSLNHGDIAAMHMNLCASSTVGGGSNARVAPAGPKEVAQAIVSPNPMAQGTPLATVELEVEVKEEVDVAIYDMLGKQYYTGNFTLIKGNNKLPLNMSNANMAAGMYNVKISGTTINKNILLMVK